MNIQQALTYGARKLRETSPSPHLDTEVLLSYSVGQPKEYLYTHPEETLSNETKFKELIRKRKHHTPIAYLTGIKEFYGRHFSVNEHTLIPRPETEALIDIILKTLTPSPYTLTPIIDIGTGSGCIAITLALELPEAKVFASDISDPALTVAKQNAKNLGASVEFSQGNLLEPLLATDINWNTTTLIANLPYLTPEQTDDYPDIAHEPRTALESGPDGLDHYRQLAQQLSTLEKKPAHLFLEIDPAQADAITDLFSPLGTTTLHKDLSGVVRFAQIQSQ